MPRVIIIISQLDDSITLRILFLICLLHIFSDILRKASEKALLLASPLLRHIAWISLSSRLAFLGAMVSCLLCSLCLRASTMDLLWHPHSPPLSSFSPGQSRRTSRPSQKGKQDFAWFRLLSTPVDMQICIGGRPLSMNSGSGAWSRRMERPSLTNNNTIIHLCWAVWAQLCEA